MPLASTVDMVRTARSGGYAVPAVNIADDLSMRAVIAAAEAYRSPVILQTSVKTVKSMGVDRLGMIARAAAEAATVPVSLHLDHCPDRAVISSVISHGWTSVLFDASDRPLETARAETAEVVAEAHAAGVEVESEIENIVGVEDGVGSDEAVHAYSARTLAEVAEETGADLIAPQLGTAHGLYTRAPELLPGRVRELAALTDIPVVLHGGTGLDEAEFAEFIEAGVGKVNISTALKLAYMHAARDHLAECERTGVWEPVKLFDAVSARIEAEIGDHIAAFGAAGKAGPEGSAGRATAVGEVAA
ncbi:class II fructose-bisphosphate aldolase [Leucobacter ruminantium]|uniref:Class II fructose-bisphosphate aldolase n=1 Tax=Leucobacter ruminantium TaxID=1289170 RepID=A0A939LZB1_9MICO|nr:class II fructose-bisphosphate aldolase [Leucobacter ruminantium]MBO1804210.1 class II fructose-bisphosphate aldolase [Leucobacter ruminantium]